MRTPSIAGNIVDNMIYQIVYNMMYKMKYQIVDNIIDNIVDKTINKTKLKLRSKLKHKKGSFYVLESAIAVVMIITTLAFVFQKPLETLELSKVNFKQQAYDALEISESVGDLRRNVLDNDASAIKSQLSSYISIGFDVAIFNKTSNLTAKPSVDTATMIAVSYFIAGEVGNYTPREVRVYMWGVE